MRNIAYGDRSLLFTALAKIRYLFVIAYAVEWRACFFAVFDSAQINVRFLIKSCVGKIMQGQVCVERIFSVF